MDNATYQTLLAQFQQAIEAAPRSNASSQMSRATRLTLQRVLNDARTAAAGITDNNIRHLFDVMVLMIQLLISSI